MRPRRLLPVLALVGLALPSVAAAESLVARAAAALRGDSVYVHPDARPTLSSDEAARLRDEVSRAGGPVLIAILPGRARDQVRGDANDVLRALVRNVGGPATYAVVVGGQFRAGSSDPDFETGEVPDLATAAFRARRREGLAPTLVDFVRRVGAARVGEDGGGDGSLSGAEIVFLAAAGGLGAAGFFVVRRRRRGEETRALKKAVEEDLVALGTDIRALDVDVELPKTSEAAKDDYGEALDAYEQASGAFDRVREPGDIRTVTDALDRGRYAMASAKARLEGREPPARRPPCFFDPRHGPSAKDVEWAPPGGVPRLVPVCAADADRLERGEEPEAREILLGRRRIPYWEVGGFGPYADGYFGGYADYAVPALLTGTAVGTAFATDTADAATSTDDFDSGGGDFGGDFGDSGGDFGGGDFGGGGGDSGGGGDFGGGNGGS